MDQSPQRSFLLQSGFKFLIDELNRFGKGREDLTELQERWNQAVALELAFFDIGYDA